MDNVKLEAGKTGIETVMHKNLNCFCNLSREDKGVFRCDWNQS